MANRVGWAWLAMPLLLLAGVVACGGSSDGGGGAAGAVPRDTVILRDISFKPGELRVRPGDTVTWRFDDKGINHNVVAEDGSFESETFDTGTFTHTFDTPGRYPYICTLHAADMKGVIVVADRAGGPPPTPPTTPGGPAVPAPTGAQK